MKLSKLFAATAALALSASAQAFSFTSGNIYSTSETAINEYDMSGNLIDSLASPGNSLRGLAFGPDHNMYVVHDGGTTQNAFVEVLAQDGTQVRTYSFTGMVSGNISYGKIAFDASGKNFYVGTGSGVYKFAVGGRGGSLFLNQDAYDINALPNGDLLVASDYAVSRYSSTGQLLGSISNLSDPGRLTTGYPSLVNVRGIQYDAKSNKTFVTMLGYSGMSFSLLQLDGFSNVVTGVERYWYGDDMALTGDDRLVVGSRTLAPGMFGTDMQYLGGFGGPAARFVTAAPVPEPETYAMLMTGLALVGAMARRGKRGA